MASRYRSNRPLINMDTVYDVCVVGAGMIGSATARHAAQMYPHLKVCLIGPAEPQSKENYRDEQILGAYFDEGRLARQMYTHPGWATIAQKAARNYKQLEKESGIPFYTEVGCLTVMKPGSEYMKRHDKISQQLQINIQKLTREQAKEKFPYIDYKDCDEGWFEPKEAGYINPRRLVAAEQTLAQKYGCHIIEDVATSVSQATPTGNPNTPTQSNSKLMEVSTRINGKILTQKVMLATGAFTEFLKLLPDGVVLDMLMCTETVVLAELSEKDQEHMRNMPSMMYNGDGHEVEGTRYLYTYILPPIRYPNGKVYLKIGHMDVPGTYKYLDSLDDIHAHYRSPGIERGIVMLKKIMNKLFPDFHPVSVTTDTCVTTETSTSRVFLDLLHPSLGVAIGGNGTAGKSCDEVGRMAAQLICTGKWCSDMPHEWFKFRQRPSTSSKIPKSHASKL